MTNTNRHADSKLTDAPIVGASTLGTVPRHNGAQRSLFGDEIQARFEEFHSKHPWVYKMIVRQARSLRSAGFTHYSMRTIWETLRWMSDVKLKPGEDGLKLNDHYPPRYARLVMDQEPDLANFFELRKLGADR